MEGERERQMPSSSSSSSGDVIEGGRERRMSGKSLLRVASSNSINLRFCSSPNDLQKNDLRFRDPGKKSFMFFTSELGKGFIISDEEEVWMIHILHKLCKVRQTEQLKVCNPFRVPNYFDK